MMLAPPLEKGGNTAEQGSIRERNARCRWDRDRRPELVGGRDLRAIAKDGRRCVDLIRALPCRHPANPQTAGPRGGREWLRGGVWAEIRVLLVTAGCAPMADAEQGPGLVPPPSDGLGDVTAD